MVRGRFIVVVLALVATTGLIGHATPRTGIAADPVTVPITVTINSFEELTDPDTAPFQGNGDYYAIVKIGEHAEQSNIGSFIQGPEPDEVPYVTEPGWEFTVDLNPCENNGSFEVWVQIWDKDPDFLFPDDIMDTAAADGPVYIVTTHNVFALGTAPVVLEGNGETGELGLTAGGEPGILEYAVTGGFTDTDGDGLSDPWETDGADIDCDGTVDVDLPAMGASPDHKDLFVEVDWQSANVPSRAEVDRIKDAFARAPIDAGGTANPDGLAGINLWVDTGGLLDGEGLAGDDLGGGNALPEATNFCTLSSDDDASGTADYYEAKAANFSSARARIFRYAISARRSPGDCAGGWGEVGGNDMLISNSGDSWALTLMHELGHNMQLGHGGNDGNSCKPNYVSVMSYNYSGGIRWIDYGQEGGGELHLDYSPPRFLDIAEREGRLTPLPDLIENNLDETASLSGNPILEFVYTDSRGRRVRQALDRRPDWNGDGDRSDSGVVANIDDNGSGGPSACDNESSDSTLPWHDDWSNFSLGFAQFGQSANAPDNVPHDYGDPTELEIAALERDLTTTDLSLAMIASPDPAVAGENVTYTITATNEGPNTVPHGHITDTLPAGVTFVDASDGCDAASGDTVVCHLYELQAGDSAAVEITVAIDPAFVVDALPGPVAITNSATTANDAAPDTDDTDNTASATTVVGAEVDLVVTKVADLDPAVAGGSLRYTIEVTNGGPSTAGGVSVTDTLPDGASYVSDDAGCSESAAVVSCDIGTLAPGATASIEVVVAIAGDFVYLGGDAITNAATASAGIAEETTSADNTGSVTTGVIASSDLAIVASEFTAPPVELLLGQSVQVTLRTTIANYGPSAPADATVTFDADAGTGSSITPASGSRTETALALDEERVLTDTLTVACDAPGPRTYAVFSAIASATGDDDGDLSNNDAEATLTVECIVPVVLNVMPGSLPSSVLNLAKGNIPVAVMTTRTGEYGLPRAFDAARIIPSTVRFGPRGLVTAAGGAAPLRAAIEDVYEPGGTKTRDGDLDLIMQFEARATGLVKGDVEACVYGRWRGPAGETFTFFGCAPVRTEK